MAKECYRLFIGKRPKRLILLKIAEFKKNVLIPFRYTGMYNSNYILVYRSELLDWTFERNAAFYLWTFIRLKAASQQKMQTVGRRAITVKVEFGQFATSKTYLSIALSMDDRTIDNILNDLVADDLIEIEDRNIYIIITVKNYEKYCPEVGVLPQTVWSPIPTSVIDTTDSSLQSQKEIETSSSNGEDSPEKQCSQLNSTGNSMSDSNQKIFPDSSIVVEEEKKKEISNLISTTTSMREKEFFEQLRNSEGDLDVIMKQMKLEKVENVLELLSVFEIHILGQDKLHKNYSDFIGHFTNWYPKYKAKKSAKSQAPKPNGTQAPRTWRDNSGIDTDARSYKDYLEPI